MSKVHYLNSHVEKFKENNKIKLNNEDDFLSWQYRLNHLIERGLSCNLKQCCKDFDVPFDATKLHDALYDIRVNYEVFKKMIWEIEV